MINGLSQPDEDVQSNTVFLFVYTFVGPWETIVPLAVQQALAQEVVCLLHTAKTPYLLRNLMGKLCRLSRNWEGKPCCLSKNLMGKPCHLSRNLKGKSCHLCRNLKARPCCLPRNLIGKSCHLSRNLKADR